MMEKSFNEWHRLMLKKPLPKEAIKPNPANEKMSVINIIYVYERLNEVFGIGGWSCEVRDDTSEKTIQKIQAKTNKDGSVRQAYDRTVFVGQVTTRLTLNAVGAVYETIATSSNEDEGDSLKGAVTDATTKICGWLGIAAYVWKGQTHEQAMAEWLLDLQEYNKAQTPKQTPQQYYDANIGKVSEAVQATLAKTAKESGIKEAAKDLYALIQAQTN